MRHRVSARSYDPSNGDVGPVSVLIDTGGALPDGLAVDSAGDLWIAMWGEGEIRRFAPDGLPRDALTTGVPYNSSCAFVGPELDLLLVTSAAGDEVSPLRTADAVDGRLLAICSPVTGLPTRAWRPCANGS
jgi:sugar lactone lactonase YvrE